MVDQADTHELVAADLARNVTSLRHARSLSQAQLASRARLPRSTLANIESGSANPSLQILVKLGRALAVPMEELLAAARAKVRHYKAREISAQKRVGRGVTTFPLVPEPTPDLLMSRMELDAGGVMPGSPHLPGTREYFTCLSGAVSIVVGGQRFDLAAGDVLAFPGNVAHSYRNDGKTTARGASIVLLAQAGV